MRDNPHIYGQLFFDNSLDSLDSLFKDSKLHHEIRYSSHFNEGAYLRLQLNPHTELTFEKVDTNEFLIRGEANDEDDLLKLADIVSSVFSRLKLKHRLELYNTEDKEFHYYNYDWSK